MKITFGKDAAAHRQGKDADVVWDSDAMINGHMLIVGKSGTGKTHTLRSCISQLHAQGIKARVHLIDVHGDIEVDGACSVKFSESTGYGMNPLEISPDPDFGGVRKRIASFIRAINRTSVKLGSRQEACMRALLQDLYAANGFLETDATTWVVQGQMVRGQPKRCPTLDDLVKFANFKLKSLYLGTNTQTVGALETLNKRMSQLYQKHRALKSSHDTFEREKMQEDVVELGKTAVDLFAKHIETIQNGHEMTDLLRYDSRDVLKSVCERLENMQSIGIFKSTNAPFDVKVPVWRYDIRALLPDEKKLFVAFVLERIFGRMLMRGPSPHVRDIIVLDEAHLYLDDDPENIINVIAKEARKFGCALWCASQSPTHFSDDFIANVGAKIVLGLDEMFWDASVRKMRIERRALEFIRPHNTLVMQMNEKGAGRNQFRYVLLSKAA